MTPPRCISCGTAARLTDGTEIYPHRPQFADRAFWVCDSCGGYVGCHKGTQNPLGTPADFPTRQARQRLHNDVLDPLWSRADTCGAYEPESMAARWKIRRRARFRVYAYLAAQLGIEREACHVGLFDAATCDRACAILSRVTYLQIREWHKQRKAQEAQAA